MHVFTSNHKCSVNIPHSAALVYSLLPFAFHALTLLVVQQKEHMACKRLSDEVLYIDVCLEQGANDLHMVQLMSLLQ